MVFERSFLYFGVPFWIYVTCRFVCELMKRSDEDELNYTEQMIGTNFSNYSAWHNRRYDNLFYLFEGAVPVCVCMNSVKSEMLGMLHHASCSHKTNMIDLFTHSCIILMGCSRLFTAFLDSNESFACDILVAVRG